MSTPAPAIEIVRHSLPEQWLQARVQDTGSGTAEARLFFDHQRGSRNRGFTPGDLVCGMQGGRAELLKRLWKQGHLSRLAACGLLADLEPVELPRHECTFALRLRRTPVISAPREWCGEMWKSAALMIVDLLIELAKCNLFLLDPSPACVLFDGPRPICVNPGSIVPFSALAYRRAMERFSRRFLEPLFLYGIGRGRLARTPGRESCEIPLDQLGAFQARNERQKTELEALPPQQYLSRLRDAIEAEAISGPGDGRPSCDDLPLRPCAHWGRQHWSVHSILKDLRPSTVLDLACRSSWIARLAAIEGAESIAADIDEHRVNHVYRRISAEGSSVLPLIIDLRGSFATDVTERLRADLVVAMGLVQHLVHSNRPLSFDQAADRFASFSRRWLLTDLTPLGVTPHGQNNWGGARSYDDEHFLRALRRRFRRVFPVEEPRGDRTLLLCEL
jgi:hypothetical protein